MKKINLSKFNIYLIINTLFLLLSVVLLILELTKYNVLPLKFLIPLLFAIVLIPSVLVFFEFKLKIKKVKIILSIMSIPIIAIYVLVSMYINKTFRFINNIVEEENYVIKNYAVLVLNDKYDDLKQLENKKIGYNVGEMPNIEEALKVLSDEISIENVEYDDYTKQIYNLYMEEIDAVLIEETYVDIIEEAIPDVKQKTKTLHTFEIKTTKENIVKNVDVKNETFNVYITGIDTYGSISSVSRSDVNIVATINPRTHQMLLTSIPRDYYVQLDGTTGYKDKLTHAGIYGVDKSVKTIENLLDIEINYYVKVNFSSVEKIIDTIGGVDVYSKYTFIGHENSTFKQGFNRVNGKQGLEFARTRKTVQGGDRTRGENQEALIQAILNKAISKDIITKYTSILNSLNGSFQTNMPMEKITDLIRNQLNDMSKWTVTSICLDGYGSSEFTYSYSGQRLYVMVPDETTVTNAHLKIEKVIAGDILESSYQENTSGNVNVPVTIVIDQPPEEIVPQEDKTEEQIDNDEVQEEDSDKVLDKKVDDDSIDDDLIDNNTADDNTTDDNTTGDITDDNATDDENGEQVDEGDLKEPDAQEQTDGDEKSTE